MAVAISEVRTHHGTTLCVETATGRIFHEARMPEGACPLLCWTPRGRPGVAFMIAAHDTATALSLRGDPERSSVISLWLRRTEDRIAVMRHPLTGRFMCAEFNDVIREIVVNREAAAEWERFTLLPASDPDECVLTAIATLSDMLARLRNGAEVLEYLEGGVPTADAPLLSAVLRILDPRELEWLGRHLPSRPDAVLALQKALPCDVWAASALPDLVIHHPAGQGRGAIRHIDESLDLLSEAGHDRNYVSAAQMCNAHARRAHRPSKGLCVIATARNEGPYLLEWLAFHRLAGVEAFFLYTNDNDAGSDALLTALAEAGVITLIRNTVGAGVSAQYKAYGHAFQMLPDLLDYRWAAVIDVDEFIVYDAIRYLSIPDFIERVSWPGTDAIGLNWLMYPATQQTHRTAEPMTHRFLRREASFHPIIKAISRPTLFVHSHCHYPIADQRSLVTFLMSNGEPHTQPTQQPWSTAHLTPANPGAWVAHYHTKSAEEFVIRRSVGRADMIKNINISPDLLHEPMLHEFRSWFAAPDLVDDTRAMECAPGLLTEMAALARTPAVAAALRLVEADYVARRSAVLSALRGDARFKDPASQASWMLTQIETPSADEQASAA